ncbi:hypothetical protein [Streptomyces sp. NPDC091212]|uniref:hypothetical protein n=1 Tax=Streptomyces sp. NPDC091212 TaxID=3155191 RepID=UPI0034253505
MDDRRERAVDGLAEQGELDGVGRYICDAGCLAGVLDAARAGLGAALLASLGEAPDGLSERHDLPPVPAIRMSAHARRGADPAMVAGAIGAMRALLAGAPAEPAPVPESAPVPEPAPVPESAPVSESAPARRAAHASQGAVK